MIVLAVFAAIALSLPGIISSEAVRTNLMERAQEITGREMQFSGDAKVSFSPFLGIEINDVVFREAGSSSDAPPILSMPTLKGSISLAALLGGQIVIEEFQFVRPKFNLRIDSGGGSSWAFPDGVVWKSLEEARTIREDTPTGETPDVSRLSSINLGTFEVSDGVIVYDNAMNGRQETITNFNGRLVWPNTRAPWEFSGSGIWRGDVFNFQNTVERPVMLMAGGASPLAVRIGSEPVNIEFTGEANRFSDFYFSGPVKMSSPSLRRVVNLLGGDADSGSSLAAFAADGRISGTLGQMQLDDAVFSLDGNRSTGNLKLSQTESGLLKISGTLASSSVNLEPYLSRWKFPVDGDIAPPRAPVFAQAEMDIRLSSARVVAGGITINEFAGGLMSRTQGTILIDIGNARIGEGLVVGTIETGVRNEEFVFKTDLDMAKIDLSRFRAFVPAFAIWPNGLSDVSANLEAYGKRLSDLAESMSGDLSISMQQGPLVGFDMTEITEVPGNRENGSSIRIAADDRRSQVRGFRLKAALDQGVAWFHDSGFTSSDYQTRLTGKADLRSGNLAIWGRLQAPENMAEKPPKQFFIGGTLRDPLLIPESFSRPSYGDQPQSGGDAAGQTNQAN